MLKELKIRGGAWQTKEKVEYPEYKTGVNNRIPLLFLRCSSARPFDARFGILLMCGDNPSYSSPQERKV
jgi:hypothetical protein